MGLNVYICNSDDIDRLNESYADYAAEKLADDPDAYEHTGKPCIGEVTLYLHNSRFMLNHKGGELNGDITFSIEYTTDDGCFFMESSKIIGVDLIFKEFDGETSEVKLI